MAINFREQRNQLMLLGIILPLAGAAYFYMYIWTPKQDELNVVEARVAALDELNTKAQRDIKRGNVAKLKAQNEVMRSHLDVMRRLVPTGNEVPALLDQVSTAARRVGLEIADVAPQAMTVGESFDIHRYRIGVSGDYHTVAQFLTNVGSLSRIIVPMNLTLQVAGRNPKPQKDRARLDARFEIQTFVSKASLAGALPAAGEGAQ